MMDEASIRKRCETWLGEQGLEEYIMSPQGDLSRLYFPHLDALMVFYRAAYADGQRDGMERAARVADGMVDAYSTDRCVNTKELSMICQEECMKVAQQIRQAAGEVK